MGKSTTVGQCWTAGQPVCHSKGQVPLQGLKHLRQLAIFLYYLKKTTNRHRERFYLQALFTVVSSEQKKFVNKSMELKLSSKEKQEARVIISQIVKVNVSSASPSNPPASCAPAAFYDAERCVFQSEQIIGVCYPAKVTAHLLSAWKWPGGSLCCDSFSFDGLEEVVNMAVTPLHRFISDYRLATSCDKDGQDIIYSLYGHGWVIYYFGSLPSS